VVALGSALVSLMDPRRADMVALLGEVTGERALRALRGRLREDASGRALLAARPSLTLASLPLAALRAQAPSTFGAAYLHYLEAHGFSPDARRGAASFVPGGDAELAYIMQRYREVHDFWHVLAGLPPTVLGETAIKWLEMVQTGLPSAALSALVAPLRLSLEDRRVLRRQLAPWAAQVGREAVLLLAVRYEDLLHLELEEVRERLRFRAAPRLAGGGAEEGEAEGGQSL